MCEVGVKVQRSEAQALKWVPQGPEGPELGAQGGSRSGQRGGGKVKNSQLPNPSHLKVRKGRDQDKL